jgi:hypothetical protein
MNTYPEHTPIGLLPNLRGRARSFILEAISKERL